MDWDDENDILYHYTSPAGLLGIIDTPLSRAEPLPVAHSRTPFVVMHASDVRYMNDAQELRFVGDLLAAELVKRSTSFSESVRSEIDLALDALPAREADFPGSDQVSVPFGGSDRVFAVCFCASGDLLSQWRGYSGAVGGYAIGIRKKMIRWTQAPRIGGKWPDSVAPTGGRLAPANYALSTPADRQKQASELADRVVLSAGSAAASLTTTTFPTLWGVMGNLAEYKHPKFEAEHEWRLIFEAAAMPPRHSAAVEFRARGNGIVPYVPIAIGVDMWGPQATRTHALDFDEVVAEVVVGPGPDMALRVDAAKSLLERCGHSPGVVRASEVPFRG